MAEKNHGPMRGNARGPRPNVANPGKLLLRLLSYIFKNYGFACIVVVICLFITVFSSVQGTLFMQTLIDDYIIPLTKQASPDFTELAHAIGRVAIFYACGVLASFAQSKIMVYVTQGTLRNLRNDMFIHMEGLPIRYFDTHPHGDIMSTYTNDIDTLRQMISQSIPQALATTSRVCSSVNVASLRAGINMDAVLMAAQTIIDAAKLTADQDSVGASKFVCFANMVEDSPFMAGAVHGGGEADAVINVGVSGPGVMAAALETLPDSASMMEVAEKIKQTAFKITRAGELMSREAARRLGVEKGIVDLSLAPTPAIGDSVARILEIIGVGTCGGPGTTCALAMLNDAVKKGGVMASSSVGGLSGAFIPVSEDAGMIAAVEAGALSLEKLEAMTCVCSVGLDMIAIPGDTPVETVAGIIADEMAIGVINNKTTAVRVIPAIGKGVGDCVEYGGLFGRAPIMPVNPNAGTVLAHRGGRFPAPLNSLKN